MDPSLEARPPAQLGQVEFDHHCQRRRGPGAGPSSPPHVAQKISTNMIQHGDMLQLEWRTWTCLRHLKALLPQEKQSKTDMYPLFPISGVCHWGSHGKSTKAATQQSHEKGGGQGR